VLDNFDDPIGFWLAGAGIDHPVVAVDYFPATAELRHREICAVEADAVFRNPRRSNLADAVAGDPQAGPLGVVAKAVFADDMFGVGRRLQGVVAVGHAVDYDVLASQTAVVHVGPT
jgi:hypothetical protein